MVRLAIATSNLNAYSETFIRAHIERLPGKITVLYSGTPPKLIDDGNPIVPDFTLGRHIRWSLEMRLRKLTWEDRRRRYLIEALRKRNIDAVLAEFGQMGVSIMDACVEAEIPLVVHFFGIDAYKSDVLTKHESDYRRLFNVAAAIVAVSQHMAEQLIRIGAPKEKVHFNPCGVDPLQFKGANPTEAPPIFLATGRFVDKKSPLLTLLAFQQVLQKIPEARLIMIGDGPLREAAELLARTSGFDNAVEFRGVVSHQEVAAAMGGARAFVQHSLRPTDGDSEGAPVAVLEASASGLPVVSTRHAGISEIIIHERTGLLVEEGDVDAMAEAMIRLGEDPYLASKMGQEGRLRIQKHYSIDMTIENLWKIIESSL